MFGAEKFKGYIKGALGWQFSKVSYDGDFFQGQGFEGDDNDSGFAGGAGAGGMYFLKENVFLNLEYEFLWLSNSFYRDDALSTFSLGVGFRF
jgi:opacity protein-like surface antigen